ncbi:CMRF35-like molecule 2 isoform X2 [Phyllopteryx taeniolatus]|uniref:CMRF35-like molecule 2 isoform X2 n=1 Tax=Phyllopteryx taeniolatus TaxID=161469 RepID=UPI002AD298F6|nr:CMRF35-like molecule 2 isoform X2 [Phyllopteryx taeniolatus]
MATLKVSICIMTDWEDIKATVIKKHVGEAVQIQCSYPFNYDKDDNFLCKGDNPVSCNRMRHKTKVLRVNERKKHFSVRIHDLSKTDSGTYWCSSNTTWKQSEYAKVQLHVDEDTKSRKSSHPTVHVTVATVTMTPQLSMLSSATTPSTHSVVKDINVAVLVCPILLAVVVLAFLVFRYTITWKQGGSSVQGAHNATNNEGDPAVHLYEEVQMQSLSGHAIVSPPADLVHYSSVSFLQDSSSILTAQTLHPETEENSSSSSIGGIQFSIPPVENMIYSTVKKPMGL